MLKVLVTTYPFGEKDAKPMELLKTLDVSFNELKRKYSLEEHKNTIKKINPEIIIAGTENYNAEIFNLCPDLKIIARVGIGLDSIDLQECKKRNIIVTYTPDAPSNAVAELVICQMLNALRNVTYIHKTWNRYIGRSIKDSIIGIFGYNRIGKLLVRKLLGLEVKEILINDIDVNQLRGVQEIKNCKIANKDEILQNSDIITLHVPLLEPGPNPSYDNHNFITSKELDKLKLDAIIINMSRGGIINENDLYDWLVNNPKAKAVIDTFCEEPYRGPLLELNNVFLTPHLGSCTEDSRYAMEVGAVEEVLNFINNKPFKNRVV